MASKLAQPKRDVVVLYGDCSFTLTGFDFITMVHRKQPFVGVIGNNSSWNQIRFGQERKYPGRGDIGNVVGDVRFDHLAEAMGGRLHLLTVSCAGSIDLIRRSRQRGFWPRPRSERRMLQQ